MFLTSLLCNVQYVGQHLPEYKVNVIYYTRTHK